MAKNWAIAIGINQYNYLQPLNYAKRDAELIRDFLYKEAGFAEVILFSDDSPNYKGDLTSPIRANLRRVLLDLPDFLRTKCGMGAGDNFWFFFSGHGMRHDGRDYLMPADGNTRDIVDTAISINFVTENLRRCGADNVVLILDACRNEGQKSGQGIGGQTAETAREQGVISIFSCNPNEYSYEIPALKQGAFTTALLEGLGNKGKCATVERLNQYLKSRVPEIVRQHQNGRQTPYVIAEPINKSHLILVPQYATLADIATLKIDAYQAEVEGNLDLAEQLWIRVSAAALGEDMDVVNAFKRIAQLQHSPANPQPSQSTEQRATKVSGSKSTQTAEGAIKTPATPTHSLLQSPNWSRRKVIQTVGFAGAGLGLAIVIPRLSQSDSGEISIPDITTTPEPTSSPRLSSPTSSNSLQTFQFETVTVNASGNITNRSNEQARYFTEDLGNGVSLEMVQIPGGTFTMGSPTKEAERLDRESPQHQVRVPGFFMGKYAVTQEQYQSIMGINPSNFKGEKRPVEKVSWDDAVEFCEKLTQKTGKTYRLPSEAEWEYACRAGTTTPFYFGETITTDLVNYNGNFPYGSAPKGEYRQQTTNVGIFPPNSFGLYDMCGNIWEWCQDVYDVYNDSYRGAPPDGSTWLTGSDNNIKLLRGGSWILYARDCRSASRGRDARANRVSNVGFRVVAVAVA